MARLPATDHGSEMLIPTTINLLASDRRAACKVLRTTSTWLGVTYKEDRPLVIVASRQRIDSGEYPERLWA